MKRKMMRIILMGVCAVCLIACGKSEKDTASDDCQEQLGMNEENTDEPADALDGNGGVQTEAEPEAEAEMPLEYVEPAAADFEYNYDAALGGVVITKYTGEAEAIRIPAEIDGDPVVKICLQYNCRITHVELPDSITSIDENAFYSCTELMEIIIPDSVTSIGKYAFDDCRSLTEITIPDSVTSIEGNAFFQCGSLTEITIPDSVTSIGKSAFARCSGLTEITISNGITIIDESAFASCSGLTEITIPDGVTSIRHSAFFNCGQLREVTIPDSVTYIGPYAFGDCHWLDDLTIPDNAEIIKSAFSGCNGTTVTYQGEEYNYANDPNGWFSSLM